MPPSGLSILLVTSEATPLAKTGGLADVAGALPLALARLGHHVTVVLPRYRRVQAGAPLGRFTVPLGADRFVGTFSTRELADGVTAVMADCPELFDRGELYGVGNEDYADNARRFAFLSRAALALPAVTGTLPDVIHAHDWQAGLTPVFLRQSRADDERFAGIPVVFTIHNLAYQGLFAPEWMQALDLPAALFSLNGIEYWGRVSFLKAGINFSDIVTTVSPTYTREIQTVEFGFGFDGILRRRADRLVGILNGIDVERWNPAADPYLPCTYSAEALDGKTAAKRALLDAIGLPTSPESLGRPLVGLVSRMVDQKGFDLLSAAAGPLLDLPLAVALLGSGDPRYEQEWLQLTEAYPGRVAARIGFDDRLAHLIIAGADLFLMPSRFEPCGLSQMYCLRYGTVPVVRRTGGLDDTVENWNPRSRRGTGFTFRDYTADALVASVDRALALYGDRDSWQNLQRAGMGQDHSWDASAREYVRVYETAIAGAARPDATRGRG